MIRYKYLILYISLVLIFMAGCGDKSNSIHSVQQWIITFSTEVGDFVYEHYGNLYTIINNVFYENKIESGVQFSPESPLEGIYVGYGDKRENLHLTIKNNSGMETGIDMLGKKMIRHSLNSPWELDKSAFPEDIKVFLEIEE